MELDENLLHEQSFLSHAGWGYQETLEFEALVTTSLLNGPPLNGAYER